MKSEVGTKGAGEGVSLKRKKPADVSGCANCASLWSDPKEGVIVSSSQVERYLVRTLFLIFFI